MYNTSEIQQMMWLDIQPKVAPQLTFLFPKIETWEEANTDCTWVGIRCDHPRYPRVNWFDPPRMQILIKYRIGWRHHWLLQRNGPAWALRRAALLVRLLLKRLAHEVETEKGK